MILLINSYNKEEYMQTVILSNGVAMPMLGFGVYQIAPGIECETAVTHAIDIGYRMFDTAQAYGNEVSVGRAIQRSGIPRKDFFLITKIWISNSGEEKAYQSIQNSLHKLNTDYVDLLLIHQPFGDYYGSYRAMERAYREGKAKAIGVSNFYPDRLIDLAHFVEIQPCVNQVETHIFNQQHQAREIMKQCGVQIMSWGPFAEGKNSFFTHEVLVHIGKKYGKSSAQVALHFLIQEGIPVIPKSIQKSRIEENFDIFDFELTVEDIYRIKSLDMNRSLFFSHHDPDIVKMMLNYKVQQ